MKPIDLQDLRNRTRERIINVIDECEMAVGVEKLSRVMLDVDDRTRDLVFNNVEQVMYKIQDRLIGM